MNRQLVGDLLDALGVEVELTDTQQVTEVVVIAKVADFGEDAGTALAVGWSKGLDWIARRGLMTAAIWMQDEAGTIAACDHDDED